MFKFFSEGTSDPKRTRSSKDPTKVVLGQNGTRLIVRIKGNGFEQCENDPVPLASNILKPKQAHCLDVRRFVLNEIFEFNKRGVRSVPIALKIPIAINKLNSRETKWISVKFAVDFNADTKDLTVGHSPVSVTIFLHKDETTVQNSSVLELNYTDFQNVVRTGRDFIHFFKDIDGLTHDSINDIPLPDIVVINQSDSKVDDVHPKLVTLMTAVVLRRSRNPRDANIGSPVVSIKQFAYDKKAKNYGNTTRGIGIGLRGLYMLAYPVAKTIRQYHDALLNLKMLEDKMIDDASAKVAELESFEAQGWLSDDNHDANELDKDELECIQLDSTLNDDLDLESDSERIDVDDQDLLDAAQE